MEAAFLCQTRYRAVDSWLKRLIEPVQGIRGGLQKTISYHLNGLETRSVRL
jgi:hypothetical protein